MADVLAGSITVADLDRLPEEPGTRYELFDGELFVSRQPHHEHQAATANIIATLWLWNRAAGLGRVFNAPGVVFGEFDAAATDVAWASNERLAQIASGDAPLHGAPELVVEVLSPVVQNIRRDREVKLRTYSRYGVSAYWLVDHQARRVEVWRHGGHELRLASTLGPEDALTSPLLPAFSVRVVQFFE